MNLERQESDRWMDQTQGGRQQLSREETTACAVNAEVARWTRTLDVILCALSPTRERQREVQMTKHQERKSLDSQQARR